MLSMPPDGPQEGHVPDSPGYSNVDTIKTKKHVTVCDGKQSGSGFPISIPVFVSAA